MTAKEYSDIRGQLRLIRRLMSSKRISIRNRGGYLRINKQEAIDQELAALEAYVDKRRAGAGSANITAEEGEEDRVPATTEYIER